MGDISLQGKNYTQATDHYHHAIIFNKRQKNPSQYRLAVLTASYANCFLQLEQYSKAKELYSEALGYLSR